MKKFYLFLGLVLVYSFLAIAMNHKIHKEKLTGRWNVMVVGAPSGYQEYIVDIKENKGEHKMDVIFVDSDYKIPNLALTSNEEKLTGSLNVDNEKVDITIWEEKGVVQGTAASPSIGVLPIEFTRANK